MKPWLQLPGLAHAVKMGWGVGLKQEKFSPSLLCGLIQESKLDMARALTAKQELVTGKN